MLNGKATLIRLRVGLIKKVQLHKMSYFTEPYTRIENKTKVELDLSNYATKSDLKNTAGIDTSIVAKKLI